MTERLPPAPARHPPPSPPSAPPARPSPRLPPRLAVGVLVPNRRGPRMDGEHTNCGGRLWGEDRCLSDTEPFEEETHRQHTPRRTFPVYPSSSRGTSPWLSSHLKKWFFSNCREILQLEDVHRGNTGCISAPWQHLCLYRYSLSPPQKASTVSQVTGRLARRRPGEECRSQSDEKG